MLVCFRNRIEIGKRKPKAQSTSPRQTQLNPRSWPNQTPLGPLPPHPFPSLQPASSAQPFLLSFPRVGPCRSSAAQLSHQPVISHALPLSPSFPACLRARVPRPESAAATRPLRQLARSHVACPSPSPGPQGSHAQARPRSHPPEAFARAQAHKSAPLTCASRSLHRH